MQHFSLDVYEYNLFYFVWALFSFQSGYFCPDSGRFSEILGYLFILLDAFLLALQSRTTL